MHDAHRFSRSLLVTALPLFFAAMSFAGPVLRADDLADLSDSFDDASTLGDWQRHHDAGGFPDQAAVLDIDQSSPGHLYIEPHVSGWYRDFRGLFLFKEVTGDFDVTARVESRGLATPVPTSSFSLAGLMVRTPREDSPGSWSPGQENWLFINTGSGDGAGTPQIEYKTTVDSDSNLTLIDGRAGWVQLTIERRAAAFSLYRQYDDAERELVTRFDRPDMPATLQVGIDAYTDWSTLSGNYGGDPVGFNGTLIESPPGRRDLVARFDHIVFSRPCDGDSCDTASFRRGDANADDFFDVGDPLATLFALFLGAELPCRDSADHNDDGELDAADPSGSLRALFLGGPPPAEPFTDCGVDQTEDALGCDAFAPCAST